MFDDGKPKSGAAGFSTDEPLNLVKPIENAILLFLGDADTCISHLDSDKLILRADGHLNPPSLGEFDAVVDQVGEDLSDTLLIAQRDRRSPRPRREPQPEPSLPGLRCQFFQNSPRDPAHIDRL